MDLEKEIFNKRKIDYNSLLEYGFIRNKDTYLYEKNILNDEFKVIINITDNKIFSKIIDNDTNLEYLGIKTNIKGEFVNKVRNEYKKLLEDIKNKCTISNYFISNQANRITKILIEKYQTIPEFLWNNTPNCGVFRNKHNNKWYGIIMNIDLSKLEDNTGLVDIINVKLERELINKLLLKKGYYKAYHMNKKDWLTIILNDTLSDEEIIDKIDKSYEIIDSKERIFMKELLNNIDKIHTTDMGINRIKKNLSINTINPVEYCKNLILEKDCQITKKGKNYYCKIDDIIITINIYSFTIITAHKTNK